MRSFISALAFVLTASLATAPATADTIRVFAAASLKTALDQALAGRDVAATYGASGTLAKQIAEGAPADVFLSADPKWVDFLIEQGAASDARTVLFGNRLVLIAPADSKVSLELKEGADLAGALGGGKLAMCNIETCPAGQYGREALASLGLWQSVEAAVAQADNVRGALAFVASGEAPLGIVYATDAAAENRVREAARFPAGTHKPIVYEAIAIKDGDSAAARDLIAFLKSPKGREAFTAQGFTLIP